jgi:hypothetical protein
VPTRVILTHLCTDESQSPVGSTSSALSKVLKTLGERSLVSLNLSSNKTPSQCPAFPRHRLPLRLVAVSFLKCSKSLFQRRLTPILIPARRRVTLVCVLEPAIDTSKVLTARFREYPRQSSHSELTNERRAARSERCFWQSLLHVRLGWCTHSCPSFGAGDHERVEESAQAQSYRSQARRSCAYFLYPSPAYPTAADPGST